MCGILGMRGRNGNDNGIGTKSISYYGGAAVYGFKGISRDVEGDAFKKIGFCNISGCNRYQLRRTFGYEKRVGIKPSQSAWMGWDTGGFLFWRGVWRTGETSEWCQCLCIGRMEVGSRKGVRAYDFSHLWNWHGRRTDFKWETVFRSQWYGGWGGTYPHGKQGSCRLWKRRFFWGLLQRGRYCPTGCYDEWDVDDAGKTNIDSDVWRQGDCGGGREYGWTGDRHLWQGGNLSGERNCCVNRYFKSGMYCDRQHL